MITVAETLTWDDTFKARAKRWLRVTWDTEDDDLEMLFDTAVSLADLYIDDPFEEIRPTIAVDSLEEGDYVTINGASFTAADAEDEDEREFAIAASNTLTADNLCALINSTTLGGSWGAVGVEGVLATNAAGTITLSRRRSDGKSIACSSSDEDRLLVRQVRTNLTLPSVVSQFVLQFMKRRYVNREALMMEQEQGAGSKTYGGFKSEAEAMAVDYTLLEPYHWGHV